MLSRRRVLSRFTKRSVLVLAASSTQFSIPLAFGQASSTWTYNGNENWSAGGAWLAGLAPGGADGVAGFGTGGSLINPLDTLTVTLDTNRTIGSLAFADGDSVNTPAGWLVRSSGGSVLTLQSFSGNAPGLDVAALGVGDGTSQIGTLFQKVAHINANLAGAQGFNKTSNGTAILSGNNAGLGGSITLTQGVLVLGSGNALGSSTLLTQRTGQLSIRSDSATNFTGINIVLQNDSTIGTGNSIGTNGLYGSGANQVHSLGNVTIDTYGVRTLGISGSNGYGLNMGLLALRDGINLINQGDVGSILGAGDNNNANGVGSGAVTVGTISYSGTGFGTVNLGGVGSMAGNITVTNGITNLGGGSASLVYSGSKTATISGAVATGGDTYVTGGVTGTTAANNYQAGVGTLVLGTGALASNKAVYINGGTLVLNGGALTHNVNGITMGGATLTSGAVPAFLNAGAGTVALGGSIVVNDSVLFNPGTTTSSVNATAAGLAGRLDLGGSTRSVTVNGVSTLTVDAIVSGTGGITKSGTGALNLTNTNTFTGSLDIQDGSVTGTVKASGNALGSTGANVSLGGALGVKGIATAGTGTVNTLTSKDSGKDSGFIVDASAGGTTTLNVNIFGGREANTHGTIKVVPVTGSLNTNEIVNLSTGAPATTNGILPAYFAVQNSGTNTGLGFASLSSNRIVAFNSYQTGNVNSATTVYDLASGTNQGLSAGKTLFGVRIGANSSISGSQVLTLGNGTTGFGGLILNGGALLSASTLQPNGADELVVWSGGTGTNSISSNLNLTGDLTTGGSTALELSGTVNLNSATRSASVTGATVTFSNTNALGNTGNLVKRGGGVLAITGDNILNSGLVAIERGTLQLGSGGTTGSVGSGPIVNNANLTFNRNNTVGSYTNTISGSGHVWVNATSTGIVTLAGPLTYTGNTTVQTGTLKPAGAANRLPVGTALRVESGATFDLNGLSTTVASIAGAGTIANTIAGTTTLTVNGGGTFMGSIRNAGAGSLSLVKTGSSTLILGGANAFSGTISVSGGTLQVNSAAASSSGNGNPNIVLDNSALTLNIPNNQNLTNAGLRVIGSSTISVITPPPVNVATNQDNVGPGFNSGANSIVGDGTLNLVLNGRMLNFGDGGSSQTGNAAILNAFSGTLRFDDSNPVGSTVRWGLGVNSITAGSTGATFAFGNGNNVINHRNGTVTFNLGYVTGGTNTILEGHSNGGGRPVTYNFGFLGGDQTYFGKIRDYTLNGGNGYVNLNKLGSGSLTLKNTLTFTGGVTVNSGTLFLGSGANIAGSGTIVTNGGTLSLLGGSTITSDRIIATVNPGFAGGGIDVTGYPGFTTPSRLTFVGGGTVYGNVNHGGGSINPGAIGTAGTLTFANALNLNSGSVDFDVTPGSANLLGSGTNDVLQVGAVNGLNLTGGVLRLNFLGAGTTPPPTVAPNQFYPIIKYNGTYTGSTANIFATAKFRGSLALVEGTGSLAGTLGAKVISLGGPTSSLIWKPVSSEFNAWDAAVGFTNFKPLVGSGSLFFFNGDSVTFDDSTTIRTVQLTPDLAPASITVNTNNTYVLSGQGFGSIVGSTGIVKNGTGTLYLSGSNTFTGGITVNNGTLVNGDPNSILLTRGAFAGGTVILNNNTDFAFLSPAPNSFSGPDGGTFVINPGVHTFYIPESNLTVPWSANFVGNGTVVWQRPNLDGSNSNVSFEADDWTSFTGTLKVSDLHTQLVGSSQGNVALRDGVILRSAGTTGGNASLTLDLGAGPAGFTLGGGVQTFTIGALRGGENSFLKQTASNVAGTYVVAGVGPQYNSTFQGRIRATNNNNIADAPIQLVNLIKSGSNSTLTLTNQQPYVGSTIVNGGTLALVNASANPLSSPTITIGAGGVLDVSGLNSGGGTFVLNANQRIVSNGSVVGSELQAVSTSTIGGTNYNIPLFVNDGATISPGNNGVGTLTVGNLLLDGSVNFLVELDQTGIDTLILSGIQDQPIVSGLSSLNLVNIGGFVPGTYTFLDYSGDANIQGGIELGFVPTEVPYEVKVIHDIANTRVQLQFVNNSAQWFVNGDGQWSTAPNWTLNGTNASNVVPNAVTFGTFITAPRTVTVNSAIGNTANSIVFDSLNKYTIAGTGTLTLDAGIAVPITVVQGNHAINSPVRALRNVGLSVATGSSLSFGGTIMNANNAGINKIGGGTATFARLTLPGGTLSVGGGKVVLSPKPTNNSVAGTSIVSNLTVSAGATLDLTNSAVILDYTGGIGSRLTDLRAELADGRLFSSTASGNRSLGYRNNDTGTTAAGGTGTAGLGLGNIASFAGVASDATSVLIRVTYKGDSNLDGIVNVLDLYNLSLNWLSTNGVWSGGDFNYDGIVNQADLGLLAQNWQQGNGSPLPGEDLGAALTAAGFPLSAVPEPGAFAWAIVGTVPLLKRRRRLR